LRAIRAHAGPIELQKGYKIFLELCEALSEIHEYGTGQPYASLDFWYDPQIHEGVTMVSTIDLVSPEVLSSGVADHRADIYSCAVIGYKLFTGSFPFEGPLIERLGQRLKGDPKSVVECRPTCSADISNLVKRAMSREPITRFQTTLELVQELRRIVHVSEIDSKVEEAWIGEHASSAVGGVSSRTPDCPFCGESLYYRPEGKVCAVCASRSADGLKLYTASHICARRAYICSFCLEGCLETLCEQLGDDFRSGTFLEQARHSQPTGEFEDAEAAGALVGETAAALVSAEPDSQEPSLMSIESALSILIVNAESLIASHKMGTIRANFFQLGPNLEITFDGCNTSSSLSPKLDRLWVNQISPEMLTGAKVDQQSDIFAFGCQAYEWITGTPPFDSHSPLDSLQMRLVADPDPPTTVRKECPIELSNVVMKALAVDKGARFQSLSELLQVLGRLNADLYGH